MPATLYDIAAGVIASARFAVEMTFGSFTRGVTCRGAMALALKLLFGYQFLFEILDNCRGNEETVNVPSSRCRIPWGFSHFL